MGALDQKPAEPGLLPLIAGDAGHQPAEEETVHPTTAHVAVVPTLVLQPRRLGSEVQPEPWLSTSSIVDAVRYRPHSEGSGILPERSRRLHDRAGLNHTATSKARATWNTWMQTCIAEHVSTSPSPTSEGAKGHWSVVNPSHQ